MRSLKVAYAQATEGVDEKLWSDGGKGELIGSNPITRQKMRKRSRGDWKNVQKLKVPDTNYCSDPLLVCGKTR